MFANLHSYIKNRILLFSLPIYFPNHLFQEKEIPDYSIPRAEREHLSRNSRCYDQDTPGEVHPSKGENVSGKNISSFNKNWFQ